MKPRAAAVRSNLSFFVRVAHVPQLGDLEKSTALLRDNVRQA